MKRLVLLLALALPIVVSAQKFGYVNTQELFQLMPEVKTAQARIDSLSSQYETMFAGMQEEYKKKSAEYDQKSATMTDAMKQIQAEELYGLQQRIQTAYQTAQQDIQTKQQEFLVPIREKMMKAIKTVGDKNGYTYIFDSQAMVYSAPTADNLLEPVKKELGIK
ncbi:MAG: OmpH family outer membrane protein [Paludibacteraceae bacterium]|nr:OmpH family outer membrane protein [Paludibacteraceae bacterium]